MKRILVIGIGNTIRGDDGVGVRVADSVAERHPGVDVLRLHQLSPELAETLTTYDRVLFVDASVTASTVRVTPIHPGVEETLPRTHDVTPAGLFALVRTLYDRAPEEAYLVEIPASSCDFSEQLSPATAALVDDALGLVETYLTGS